MRNNDMTAQQKLAARGAEMTTAYERAWGVDKAERPLLNPRLQMLCSGTIEACRAASHGDAMALLDKAIATFNKWADATPQQRTVAIANNSIDVNAQSNAQRQADLTISTFASIAATAPGVLGARFRRDGAELRRRAFRERSGPSLRVSGEPFERRRPRGHRKPQGVGRGVFRDAQSAGSRCIS
jgi:hypothetical protein